jgi:PPOX class probable F420-dependent enzyme
MENIIPDSHRELLAGPVNVVLTTLMQDGRPQTTPIWCNLEGDEVLINTMQQFQKAKNMQANPRVTLLAYRLQEAHRNIEVRGQVVEMTEEGALQHLDELNMMYSGKTHFFGDAVPKEFINKFTPLKVRIRPNRVRVEG